MGFGIHNSAWLDGPDPAEVFEAVKAKAEWAENHGFVWFSVLDPMIQIPPRRRARRAGLGRLDRPGGARRRYQPRPSRHPFAGRSVIAIRRISPRPRRAISRGRLTLGIGAGFFEEEYKQYGWEFPPRPATRIRQMEEAVQLILKMWAELRTTFHSRYFHVKDAISRAEAGAKAASAGATSQMYGTSWRCCADIATRRAAITIRSKRPVSCPGYLPAMRSRCPQSASGWPPADRCAALSVRCPRPST
jgi:Luciferase-like monooxygenase